MVKKYLKYQLEDEIQKIISNHTEEVRVQNAKMENNFKIITFVKHKIMLHVY